MLTIFSGGQTGVDRGALDAALECGIPCGGWCPKGRKAEDGPIPECYPLQEMDTGEYKARTRKNVQDTDGTVIIYFGELTGGTALTFQYCLEEGKPNLLVNAEEVDETMASKQILNFYHELFGECVNVAGPRASGESRAYTYAKEAIKRFIALQQA